MPRYCMFLMVAILLSFSSGLWAESTQRTLVNRLLFSRSNRFGGLDEIPENEAFFEHRVTPSNLRAVQSVVGRKVFDRLHLEDWRGRPLRDLLDYAASRSLMQERPNILTALARDAIDSDDVALRLGEEDGGVPGEEIEISDPARNIPADEIYRYTEGPRAGTRAFRNYLEQDFGLENRPPQERPDEIEAFSVFNNFASGLKRGDIGEGGRDLGEEGLPDSEDPSKTFDYLRDHFVQDARPSDSPSRGREEEDSLGLFLPSKQALERIKDLLAVHRELSFARDEGRMPATGALDAEALQDLMRSTGVRDLRELQDLSPGELKDGMFQLVSREVQQEIERNDYVYELSSVAHAGGAEPVGAAGGGTAFGGPVNPSFTVGNEAAEAELQDLLEQSSREMTEAERMRFELENLGAFHVIGDIEEMESGAKCGTFFGPCMYDGFLNLRENPRE